MGTRRHGYLKAWVLEGMGTVVYGTYMYVIGDCISCIMIGCAVRVYIAGCMATGC